MTPAIVQKPEMKVLGYMIRTSSNGGCGMRDIPAFWQRYLSEGLSENIPNKLNSEVQLGMCVDFVPETGEFGYLIGFEVADETGLENEELVLRTIPAATYAVFTTPPATNETFSKTIQGTRVAIFQDWFPSSGYEQAETPEFEWYDERSDGEDDMQMDIYIPIKQRVSAEV